MSSPQENIYEEIRNAGADLTKLNIPMGKEFIQYNNHRVHIRTFWPKDENGNLRIPKAIVIYVHGYCSHISRLPHKYLGSLFPANDIAYITYDNFGHGYSTGTMGLVLTPEEMTNLTLKIVNLCYSGPSITEEHFFEKPIELVPSTTPLFIMGQSMGGAIALLAALKLRQANINFQGCIFLCPALKVSQPSPVLQFMLDYVLGPFFPESTMPASMSSFKDPHDTWVNDDYIKYIDMDQYPAYATGLSWGEQMRYGSAVNLLNLCNQAVKAFPFIHYPFLIFHDPLDKVTSIEGSQSLLQEAATPAENKKLIEMPHGAHDLTTNRLGEISEQVLLWIQERVR